MCLTCSVGLDKELAYYVLSICAYIMREWQQPELAVYVCEFVRLCVCDAKMPQRKE